MNSSTTDFDVGIIGGGVIGLASAYQLVMRGYNVGIFEKRECIACEASRWNAGLIVPSMYYPLPLSASLPEVLKWILSKKSPVKVSIKELGLKWTIKMLSSKRELKAKEYWRELRRLWKKTVDLVEELIAKAGIECDFKRGRIIEVYADEKAYSKVLREVDSLEEDGVEFEVLDHISLREEEPALSREVVGGIMYLSDAHLDPIKFSEKLGEYVENLGVEVFRGLEVENVDIRSHNKILVKTSRSDYTVERLVVAAGPWTSKIIKELGVDILVKPARGYTIYLKPNTTILKNCLMLEDVRVVAAPTRNGGTRISGVLDLVGFKVGSLGERVNTILSEASRLLPYISRAEVESVHSAFRPCTPDGIPIVSKHPKYSNVIVASGHCRFGLTFSMLTGELVEKLVSEGELPENLRFLSIKRLLT